MSKKRRCPYCTESYEPYARAVERQKHCGAPGCRRKHKRARDRAWRSKDPQWRKARQAKVRDWAGERHYWRSWRAEHPEYRRREVLRMRHKRKEAVAKQEGLGRDSLGDLERIRYGSQPPGVAKQDRLARRFEALLDYLIARECVAKQEGADGARAGAV